MNSHRTLSLATSLALVLAGCSGGPPQQTASTQATQAPAPPPASDAAAAPETASQATAAAAAPSPDAAARPPAPTPEAPLPVTIAVAGADGHGKSTLLAAISQALAKRGLGSPRSVAQLSSAAGAELAFDSGARRLTLKEYGSQAALVAALGKRGSGLAGFVLVVAQADGLRPQTREQIEAAGKVGLKPLLVAQTKDDIVDDAELKDLEQSEIEQALVEAGLLAEADAGTWEKGKYKPGTKLPFLRVSAKRALEGDAGAQKAIAALVTTLEKRAGGR